MSSLVSLDTPDGRISVDLHHHIRFLFPQLVSEAVKGLKKENWEPWYASFVAANGVTEEQLIEGWQAYMRYMQSCLSLDDDQQSPKDALIKSGFIGQPHAVQLVILAKMGQLMTASVWWPLREGTLINEKPIDVSRLAKQADALKEMLK